MPNDPLHELQRAARRAAQHVANGVSPRWCLLLDEHRKRIVEVRVPCCGSGDSGQGDASSLVSFAAVVEARPGWDFTRAAPQFDGTEVKLAGRPLDVVKALYEAGGPLKIDAMRKIWDGYDVGDSTIRYAIAEARKKLAEQFASWEGEFIANGPHGYTLEFK